MTLGYAVALVEYLQRAGHDPRMACGPACLDWLAGNSQERRIPLAQWGQMLRDAGRQLGDPAFVLRLASTIRPRHLGMLGFLLMSCDTLAAAAATLQRYEQLFDGINTTEVGMDGGHCTLTWRPLIDEPPFEFVLMSLALWAHHARWLTEKPDITCDAEFAFTAPQDATMLAAIQGAFGGTVRFGMPGNRLIAPAAHLALPVVHGNGHVHASLRDTAEADLARLLGARHAVIDRLEALLAQHLESRMTGLEHMARLIDVAPRTLQARLDEQGLSYRQLLDRVRCRQAERLLRDPARSLADVAALTGFSNQSAFQHAFKRWTGASPGDWRRRAGAEA